MHQSLWNLEVYHCVHKSLPLVLFLWQINPALTTLSYLRSILIFSYHLSLGLSSGLFSSGCPIKTLYTVLFWLNRATFPAHIIFIDFIIWIISEEEYKLWSSTLCGFLQPQIVSSLLRPNILLGTLYSNTLSTCSSLCTEMRSLAAQFSACHSLCSTCRRT
jgi:hypothetical protein